MELVNSLTHLYSAFSIIIGWYDHIYETINRKMMASSGFTLVILCLNNTNDNNKGDKSDN